MHILHVVGARPNFMKAAPVLHALGKRPAVKQHSFTLASITTPTCPMSFSPNLRFQHPM